MPADLPTPGPIEGEFVRLDALSEEDLDDLYPILAAPEVYAHGYVMHRRPVSLEDARELAAERFLSGQGRLDGKGFGRNAYSIRLRSETALGAAGTLVGTTSLMQADVVNESIHLGSTLYGPRWWGTTVNPECKFLLMRHCFEDCRYGRVKIQTDVLNVRSTAAIARLGAVREGVMRRDMRREDGTFRDTVVFSVLADEWPAVKRNLAARIRTAP